jgi:transposase
MKIEIVIETGGLPIALAIDAANVGETALGLAAVAGISASVEVAGGTPLIGDRGYDSDDLREEMLEEDLILIAPHRKNRVQPSMNDGRRLRRYKRRYKVERTFAWLHSYRRAVIRYERYADLFEGFVSLACAIICLNRLL